MFFYYVYGNWLNGGENIKIDNKLLFTLIISIMLLLSLNAIFAEDNNATGDVVSQSIELDNVSQCHELSNLQAVQHGDVLSAGGGVINVKVRDSYNQSNKSWVEEGIVLPGATVKIYDSSNSLISTLKTNSKGLAS